MKALLLASGALAAAIAIAPAAQAGHGSRRTGENAFYDNAKVLRVEPIKRIVRVSTPEEECWDEEVRYPAMPADTEHGVGKVVLGGIVGGVIGHQIGKGRGKDAATAVGTLIGAAVGHNSAMKQAQSAGSDRIGYEQRCRVAERYRTEERIDGYRVTYRYRGQTFNTHMPYDPGERIRVRIEVAPVDD